IPARGCQQHALALDAAKGRRREIRHHHDLPADQRLGRVVGTDAGDDLPRLATQIDAQHDQPVGIGMRVRCGHRSHLELQLAKLLDRDHARSSRSSAAIASSAWASKRLRMVARSSSDSFPISWSSSISLIAASAWRFCRSQRSRTPGSASGPIASGGLKSGEATKKDTSSTSTAPRTKTARVTGATAPLLPVELLELALEPRP